MKIIDISQPLVPGRTIECKIPKELPVYEGYPCIAYEFAFASHQGCYYETSAHLFPNGTMTSDVPVEKFFLPAVITRLDPKAAGALEPDELLPGMKTELRPGDALIVDAGGNDTRYFSRASGRWMAERKVRLLGASMRIYDTGFENPTGIFVELFRAEIPIIANLKNIEQIAHDRVILIALPMAVEKVCTIPCRAVILDGTPAELHPLETLFSH